MLDERIIKHDKYKAIINNNRFADNVPANYVLYNKINRRLEYFIKGSSIKNDSSMKINMDVYEDLSKTDERYEFVAPNYDYKNTVSIYVQMLRHFLNALMLLIHI